MLRYLLLSGRSNWLLCNLLDLRSWRQLSYTRSWRLLFVVWSCLGGVRIWQDLLQNRYRIAVDSHHPPFALIIYVLLRNMHLLPKVIPLFHQIRQALLRNIEQINKRLNISLLQKSTTNILFAYILSLLGADNLYVLGFQLFLFMLCLLCPCDLVQQQRTRRLGWLFEGFELTLLLGFLDSWWHTFGFGYLFIWKFNIYYMFHKTTTTALDPKCLKKSASWPHSLHPIFCLGGITSLLLEHPWAHPLLKCSSTTENKLYLYFYGCFWLRDLDNFMSFLKV